MTKVGLFFLVVVVLGDAHGQSCDINNFNITDNLVLQEGAKEGTEILRISDQDDLVLNPRFADEHPPYVGLANGTLFYNATVDLDSNTTWCGLIDSRIYIYCKNAMPGPYHGIFIDSINYTDDFPLEFKTNHSSGDSIQEMIATGHIAGKIDKQNDVIDRDCKLNPQNDVHFEFVAGNTNEAFRIHQFDGVIKVNRLLDYENGDRHFLLNISVSDKTNPDRDHDFKIFEVNIDDIDDNDPVFNHSHYRIHVQEESPESLTEWKETSPPIGVHDPDVDVENKENLIISLFDDADATTLKVNATDGTVQMSRMLDRELNSSVLIPLKVQQSITAWRSSTTTLTVIVDDINDNRPLFQPSTFDVTVPEHSSVGSSIVLLTATDLDEGENADFTYTLTSQQSVFSIHTRRLGDTLYGVLTVKNSSLLDREATPELIVNVSTVEATAAVGGNCNAGECSALVTVTLLDINDNSPVFDRPSYRVTVNDVTHNALLVKMNASDADIGHNGRVTFSLEVLGGGQCSYVIINDVTGDVTLNGSVTQSVDCSTVVTACDNPVDTLNRRCSSVVLQLSLFMANDTVVIQTPLPASQLRPLQATLQRNLTQILGVATTIRSIQASNDKSVVYISAVDSETQQPIPALELQKLVDGKSDVIQALFAALIQTEQSTAKPTTPQPASNSDVTSAVVIALIVVASVLLLAFIAAIVVIVRGRKSENRKERLLHQLSKTDTLYHAAELGQQHHEPTDLDLSLLNRNSDPSNNNNNPVGVINPIYENDTPRSSDSSEGKEEGERSRQRTETTTTFASERDADSGVPSDRENGNGESDSESGNNVVGVVMEEDGLHSTEAPVGSSYLNAVLNDRLRRGGNRGGLDDKDMVNVVDDPQPITAGDSESGLHARDNYEEQSNSLAFADDDEGSKFDLLTREAVMFVPVADNPVSPPESANEDEDVPGLGSKFMQLLRPGTPPRARKSTEKEEEEEEEEELPEEPEPDYGKKVRFSQHALHIENFAQNKEHEEEEDKETKPEEEKSDVSQSIAPSFPSPVPSSSDVKNDATCDPGVDVDVYEDVTTSSHDDVTNVSGALADDPVAVPDASGDAGDAVGGVTSTPVDVAENPKAMNVSSTPQPNSKYALLAELRNKVQKQSDASQDKEDELTTPVGVADIPDATNASSAAQPSSQVDPFLAELRSKVQKQDNEEELITAL